ncbi:MAG: hypoxanthine phosphoribosyltransferase [Deltaproteobacteria bacterium]|nr:hypoxanthine phosphoribosyltransferase [Deltaproteobacteria bacterium]
MELLHNKTEIAQMVSTIGAQIDADYANKVSEDNRLLIIGVLNGAFIFMADLVRAISLPVEMDFIRLSSYEDQDTSNHHVVMLKAPERTMEGRHILIVEDIADCGYTLQWFQGFLLKENPSSVKIAVAVDKRERRETFVPLDYVGFVENEGFLVGYGLDYAQSYRNLDGIYRLRF